MKTLRRRALILFLAVLCASAHAEGWDIKPAPDGYRARWAAEVVNTENHVLRIWRRIEGIKFRAYVEFVLADGKRFGNTLPELRIDGGEFRPIEQLRETTAKLHPDRVVWQLWASTTAELGPYDAPRRWMQGNVIEFRYIDNTGAQRETAFTLSGSNAAIDRIVTGTYK